ncbi:hypothetical protein [Calderihabitans maritimus]|uniref:Uncharacterized protein n=1 Tax=Calderihabitans maritimus TaxID=1246530 RepID=A0A1Z5HRX8_9FIRM|nr:hypothetical protein [Calderihabitans maritimus]GAW92075.1 hypothetical protein KKC1_12350 [Calderihabitans maritimus]
MKKKITKPPKISPKFNPMTVNVEFAEEALNSEKKQGNFTVNVEPPPYVGRGGVRVKRNGNSQDDQS